FILKQKKDYSFEYSKELVLEVYKNFSDNFFNLANNIFEHQHVHSDSLKNKKSGAFCYSYDKDKIPFILLNHNNDLNSLFTMAHELGHGIHSSLSKNKTQSTFHPSIVIAETASIFGEMLLMDHLKNKASKEEKLYILFHHLDSLFSTILRQIYFTLFEIKAYDKILQGASIAELSEIYNTILTQQFNDMEISEQFNFEWLRIPHIFESPFYCYSYAFGNLLVLALFKLYEKDKESFVTKYTNILSQGGDEDVSEILIKSGIDISNQEFWESAFNKIEDYLTELETLVNN
ncbi:MAG: M3 family metallopeptidase, partial [Candidatus Woesearchaeota archaeon]